MFTLQKAYFKHTTEPHFTIIIIIIMLLLDKMYLLHVSREFKIKREKISYAGPSDSNNGRKIVECFSVTVKRVCMYTLMGSNLVKVVQLAKKLSTYLPFC